MRDMEKILEMDKIKTMLKELACTKKAKEEIDTMNPLLSARKVKAALRETTQARQLMEHLGNPPLTSFANMEEYLACARQGGCLTPEQLEEVAQTLAAVSRLKGYLSKGKTWQIGLSWYEENLNPMDTVREEISRMIRGGRVDDYATGWLRDIRREIAGLEIKIREKADALVKVYREILTDQFSTTRSGRICLPVKKQFRSRIPGSLVDRSATGSTCFIEPASLTKLQTELDGWRLEEENEERTILYTLTGMLADAEEIFRENQRTFERLDFLFAKGKLSIQMEAVEPEILSEREIHLEQGRHPLMDRETCVPLDFSVGGGFWGVVITGPNTGGKTVAIKTVGLNCLMAQCGLHVTCKKARLCLNNRILCDIGDGQNIEENLSTFSAHITNVLDILARSGPESLVIMDELGSGTDPTEGMGIAVAILEELRRCGCIFLVTTHYPEVKNYAEEAEGLQNARMAFDRESLKPLYRLEIGKAGESCALYIAKKLGMPAAMLRRASLAAYGQETEDIAKDAVSETIRKAPAARLEREPGRKQQERAEKFQVGDSVMVLPEKKIGIVCRKSDERGMLRVQMPWGKIRVSHKRLRLQVAADRLYPEDYDFSIIFDTVANRKLRHQMERKHVEGAAITVEEKG
ncbi:MAG TPA: DNA mismatch repair protein MutS [Candidatus Pullilachnospira intestinigallinarum]|nr:DNA mismatch repair protein MutS [Candidatus Pullilachnospira intestinigallinarum]